jgi:hypothetical protein
MYKNNTYQTKNQNLHIIDERTEKNKKSDNLEYIFKFNLSSGNRKINVDKILENEVENKLNIIEKKPNEKVTPKVKKKPEKNIEKNDYISPNFNNINCNYNLYNLFYSNNAL